MAYITYVDLLRGLAQSRVVLLDEVPADLVVGELGIVLRSGGVVNAGRCCWVTLEGALVLLLLTKASVGSHDCVRFGRREEVIRCRM